MDDRISTLHGGRTLEEALAAQQDSELEALGGEPLVGSGHEDDVAVEVVGEPAGDEQ